MSIRSMTGYGQGSAETPRLQVAVEARSLNNRFLDVRLRLPSDLASLEPELKRRVQKLARRGRVDLSLTLARNEQSQPDPLLNRALLDSVIEAARELTELPAVSGTLDVNTLLAFPGIVQTRPLVEQLDEETRAAVGTAIEHALLALDAERRREGASLARDLLERLTRLQQLAAELRRRATEVPAAVRAKLEQRLELLSGSVEIDPHRLAQELALLADRADVTEELVRVDSHLEQMRHLLSEPDGEPVGKRLEFLLQEVHRENNTVGNKSADLQLSHLTLDVKAELEKIREQVQNLE